MTAKLTTRTFTLAVPDGTELRLVRSLVRAADGTDHPEDREVEVPRYRPAEASFACGEGQPHRLEDVTEAWVLSQHPPGTLAVSCRDEPGLKAESPPARPKGRRK
jgi:hypothetical protein